ncbi:MAG: DUF6034 family protein [Roseburia sp.]
MLRRKMIAGMSLCMVALLSGCGARTVDYNVDDTEVTEFVQDEGTSGLSQLADAGSWEAAWNAATESGNTINYQVNAKITVPDVDSMYVIEVKAPEEGEAYTEQVVKAVFGDGEVFYYDDVRLPKAPLQDKIKNYEDSIAANQAFVDNNQNSASAEYHDDIQRTIQEEQEKLAACREALKTASEDYIPVSAYDSDAYRGIIDGVAYILRIEWSAADMASGIAYPEENGSIAMISRPTTDDTAVNEQETVTISLSPEDIYQVCPEAVSSLSDLCVFDADASEGEANASILTAEEADQLAQAALEDMGFSNPVQSEMNALCWAGDMEDREDGSSGFQTYRIDGYRMQYVLGMDELSLAGFGTEVQYSEYDKSSPLYSMAAYAEVYVTERGVITMHVHNPMEVTTMTEDVKLLPLEKIQKIICDELENDPGQFPFAGQATVSFHSMDLIYFRVRDDSREGYYSYIPAWRLCEKKQGGEAYENVVVVNAIDGSIIDLAEEFQ